MACPTLSLSSLNTSISQGKVGDWGMQVPAVARRAPRTLEIAISKDVKNLRLEREAHRALVGLFGEGWCTIEFATLPPKTRDSLLKGLSKRMTPFNIFALILAAQHVMDGLNRVINAWADKYFPRDDPKRVGDR